MANKHTKGCLTSLHIREMQIITTVTYHFISTSMTQIMVCVGEDVEKLEPSYVHEWNVNWCSCFEKVWQFLKLNIDFLYDTEISLLAIYPGEMRSCLSTQRHGHECSVFFIIA